MKKILFPLIIFILSGIHSIAGDTISINNTYFYDPIAERIVIDINKKKIDQSLITSETDQDENVINKLLVDYKIIFTGADTLIKNNITLFENQSNEVFQIILSNIALKQEKQQMLISILLKKDGVTKSYNRNYNLYYIHNYITIDSVEQSGHIYHYSKRDTIKGVNNNQLRLFYSINLNAANLGITDIVTNPFYSSIKGKSLIGNSNNDTLIIFDDQATNDKNLHFSQNIILKDGLNKLQYTLYDTEKDWLFSDSIMFFFIQIDKNQQREFCKSDPLTKLKGIPDGGSFRYSENNIGIQSGLIGNTNVFNPSMVSDQLENFPIEYQYRYLYGNKIYYFSDTMRIKVNSIPPDFYIDGKSEVCANEEGVEYSVISKQSDYDPSNYTITWKLNNTTITGNGEKQTIGWESKMLSELAVIITDNTTGCAVNKHKFIKVGSNKIPVSVPNMACKEDTEKKNVLLYSTTTENINQYTWNFPDGSDSTTTSNYLLLPQKYGVYSLKTSYNNNPGCFSKSTSVIIDPSTSVKIADAQISPNPFTTKISINLPDNYQNELEYSLKNQSGDLVKKGIVSNTDNEIDCSSIHSGIYILTLFDGEITLNKKIVKK